MATSMKKLTNSPSRGFSLIELMFATVLFTFIAGIVFSLLTTTQLHYGSEKDLMAAFQSANIAMDQIARDVHTAGYPPANSFSASVANDPSKQNLLALPFAWSTNAGYPTSPCTIAGNCDSVPGDFDLILEADLGNGVQWIRYELVGTTLMRAVAKKRPGHNPVSDTDDAILPYLENVMNGASSAQMAQIRASYPAMFPGGNPVPVFTYTDDSGAPAAQTQKIRRVNICLIVQSPRPDPVTGQPRVLTLTGQAMRFNPSQ
jgi:prepilin-type N-terminal cleavage/methylation domain-containing protein